MILKFSFLYMVIHLMILTYKKGESLRVNISNYSSPVTDERYLRTLSIKIKRIKISIQSLYSKKYRMMNQEIKKSHNEPFSEEFSNLMVTNRFVLEMFNELVTIFDIKEYKAYKKFNFTDDFKTSRLIQFHDTKKEVCDAQNNEFVRILKLMHIREAFMEVEKKEWEDKLKNAGEIPKEKTIEIKTVAEAFKENNNETNEIIERTVTKRQANRF